MVMGVKTNYFADKLLNISLLTGVEHLKFLKSLQEIQFKNKT